MLMTFTPAFSCTRLWCTQCYDEGAVQQQDSGPGQIHRVLALAA